MIDDTRVDKRCEKRVKVGPSERHDGCSDMPSSIELGTMLV